MTDTTQPEALHAGIADSHMGIAARDAEIERLRGEVALLRAAMEGAAHQLSNARIWNGQAWHYNPLHPMHYRPALDRLRAALEQTK